MSVEGTLPATHPPAIAPLTTALIGWAALLVGLVGCGRPASPVVLSEQAPAGSQVAFVRLIPCGSEWCESLWIGAALGSATRLATLPAGQERCHEITWVRDGTRVAFLINGYQLRLYDARSLAPAGLMDLVPADGTPTRRIARGVTFSDTGAAVTFDDCPRERSGCKPGMLGLR